MGKEQNKSHFNSLYRDPFMSPRANSKHAFHQVNGETQQSQHNIVLEAQMRKRT
ncbi:YpzG family protein [Shouchella sp. JSM 1781072]|uniref:YpzG family protein n=1 Tax=Bacillaceae TaxID=186817 RepID=UPI000C068B6F|nr:MULTISPECIES: YpzG family protein [Bacillaceae]UTR07687.1 YpzG family protein [Alkalihalobacillus sp. LMS6]